MNKNRGGIGMEEREVERGRGKESEKLKGEQGENRIAGMVAKEERWKADG